MFSHCCEYFLNFTNDMGISGLKTNLYLNAAIDI